MFHVKQHKNAEGADRSLLLPLDVGVKEKDMVSEELLKLCRSFLCFYIAIPAFWNADNVFDILIRFAFG